LTVADQSNALLLRSYGQAKPATLTERRYNSSSSVILPHHHFAKNSFIRGKPAVKEHNNFESKCIQQEFSIDNPK
jgi:hypothetical protein